jgi:hypothetical protein
LRFEHVQISQISTRSDRSSFAHTSDAFLEDLSQKEIGELATLMKLWLAIEDAQARWHPLKGAR